MCGAVRSDEFEDFSRHRAPPERRQGFGSLSNHVRELLMRNEPLLEHFDEQSVALLAPEVDEFDGAVMFPSSFAAAKLPEAIVDGAVFVRLQWH